MDEPQANQSPGRKKGIRIVGWMKRRKERGIIKKEEENIKSRNERSGRKMLKTDKIRGQN